MPTVLRDRGFRYFFFSNEGQEAPHIHVEKGEALGKFWLNPTVLAQSIGFTRSELRQVRQVTEQNSTKFLEAWNAYFTE